MPAVAAAVAEDALPTAVFSVHARAEPGVLPRVLELFAKRGLVPLAWHGALTGADEAELTIDIRVRGLARNTVDYLAACLRQIVFVEAVLTTTEG